MNPWLFPLPEKHIENEISVSWPNVTIVRGEAETYPETGFYNYNARLYDPMIGRFLSADTIIPDPFNSQAFNRYAYCINNPIIYTDPSGHAWYHWVVSIVATVAINVAGIASFVATGSAFGGLGYFAWTENGISFGAIVGGSIGIVVPFGGSADFKTGDWSASASVSAQIDTGLGGSSQQNTGPPGSGGNGFTDGGVNFNFQTWDKKGLTPAQQTIVDQTIIGIQKRGIPSDFMSYDANYSAPGPITKLATALIVAFSPGAQPYATAFPSVNTVILHNPFFSAPPALREFILLHEWGHLRGMNESQAQSFSSWIQSMYFFPEPIR